MMRIVLIRPGATQYDQQGRIQGVLNVPLSEEGTTEVARACGELAGLGIARVYASDCDRAVQTASAIAAALGVKMKTLDNMQNLDHGLWQGLLFQEVKRKQPKVYRQWQEQPESMRPPDGETLTEASRRVEAALSRILKKHKEGTVGLVVPEPLASLVRAHLDHTELGDLWRAATEHGTWEIIDVTSPSAAHSG